MSSDDDKIDTRETAILGFPWAYQSRAMKNMTMNECKKVVFYDGSWATKTGDEWTVMTTGPIDEAGAFLQDTQNRSALEPASEPEEIADLADQQVQIDYTNWKGERSLRIITPLTLSFDCNPYHPVKQWLLTAYDHKKKEKRTFAMSSIHGWFIPVKNESTAPSSSEKED